VQRVSPAFAISKTSNVNIYLVAEDGDLHPATLMEDYLKITNKLPDTTLYLQQFGGYLRLKF